MLFGSLIVAFFFAARYEATCEDVERFPNARYLGMAYNLIMGNPDNDLYDPGFGYNVLEFTWATGKRTSDRKYLVPDHIQALQVTSCSYDSLVQKEFGPKGYQNALSADVSVEPDGFWDWLRQAFTAFTASIGYKKVKQETKQNHCIYVSARGKCIQYQLSVNYRYESINVTNAFAKAVSSLPLSRNDRVYNNFIRTYGTHFTSKVTMGAKMVVRSEFNEVALTSMEETGFKIEIGAQLSFRFAVGVTIETKLERQQREKFESLRSSYTASYLGSHPPSDGRWETWAQSTANSPYPVEYELAPLTSVITNKFFPSMPSDELSIRHHLLTAAYEVYCNGTPGCAIPPPDPVPFLMKENISNTFKGITTVSCPPRYSLLSCGILNDHLVGDHDKQRYAIPANNKSCECLDRAGAKCVSWCSNTAVGFEIAKSPLATVGNVNVTCPTGYKVRNKRSK